MLRRLLVCASLLAVLPVAHGAHAPPTSQPFPVTIRVDAAKSLGPLKPIWRFFGYDEPNYTYMPDGLRLLDELSSLAPPQSPVDIRCHNLLTTGDGTPAFKWGSTNAYTEDAAGKPVYDWTITDRIFDAYLKRGLKPYAQIGFMPEALSSHPHPYRHHWKPGDPYDAIFTGWAYPPKDYDTWRELNFQWVRHCVEKYGRAEVESWYWEVWNEPNYYFKGTEAEYEKLYDYAVDGVRRALPTARVGGPHVAGTGSPKTQKYLRDFLEHCVRGKNFATGNIGSPIDFIAFHAKGDPKVFDGHVRMGIAHQLNDIDAGMKLVASFPELKDKPVVVGESDPDGCAACPSSLYPQNGYRNGPLYAAYTAASVAREYDLMTRDGANLLGAVTWAFEFENQPPFAGFRVLATRGGVALPVLNVFRMLSKMTGDRIAADSSAAVSLDAMQHQGVRGRPDVAALASLADRKLCVLVWHYHDDDVPGPAARVELSLAGLPSTATQLKLEHFRIDQRHSNAFAAWQKLGSPPDPTDAQQAELLAASKLQPLENAPATIDAGTAGAKVTFDLPRQGISLLVLTW